MPVSLRAGFGGTTIYNSGSGREPSKREANHQKGTGLWESGHARQVQLEEEKNVVKREPGEDDEALVKEEKDIDDDLESNLPNINDIINEKA